MTRRANRKEEVACIATATSAMVVRLGRGSLRRGEAMIGRVPHILAAFALLFGMSACAGAGSAKESVLVSAVVSRFPACANEIRAFFALNKLVVQSGADRDVYEPALQAMEDQMTDCVDDNYDPHADIQPIAGLRQRVERGRY